MSGNTFGRFFRVSSFGESHGPALGCVVDGCPPGLEITEEDIQQALNRRRPGQSRFVTQRREPDEVEILSGVFNGVTTGTPIGLLIRNQSQRSSDYSAISDKFRPGHADFTYHRKYGIRDFRGGGRASARETAARVAAGAIAQKWLKTRYGITIRGCLTQLGNISIPFQDWTYVDQNPFFSPNLELIDQLQEHIEQLRQACDSCGARVQIVAQGVPPGWGAPVFDRLDASIAYAMMGINAVKAVEIGDGFASADMRGSVFNDQIVPEGFLSNHAGGILGGISSGQTISVRLAIKPTPSIAQPLCTTNETGEAAEITTKGRHDPCVGIRAVPVAEAMMALTLIDAALQDRAQNADVHRLNG